MSVFCSQSPAGLRGTLRVVLLGCCALQLSACSIWSQDKAAYRKVQLLPPLRVPPGLELPPTNDTMAIPHLSLKQAAAEGVPLPDTKGRAIDAPPELLLDQKTPAGSP